MQPKKSVKRFHLLELQLVVALCTSEIKPMKHIEGMKMKENPKQKKVVKEEHGDFTRCDVAKVVPKNEVSGDATIIGSTWAMKKKHTDSYRARLNAHGCEKIYVMHYDGEHMSSKVVN